MSLGVEVGGAGEQQGMGKRYPQQPTAGNHCPKALNIYTEQPG